MHLLEIKNVVSASIRSIESIQYIYYKQRISSVYLMEKKKMVSVTIRNNESGQCTY